LWNGFPEGVTAAAAQKLRDDFHWSGGENPPISAHSESILRVTDQALNQMPTLRTEVTSVVAGMFALAAFTVAVLAGLMGGNDMVVILVRAMIALIVCYPLGMMAGALISKVIAEGVRDHAGANPIPALDTEQATDTASQVESTGDEDVIVV
jgi:hypothetical protein